MTARLIDGKRLSETLRLEIAQEVDALRERTGTIPHLAAVLVGDDPASSIYVRNKERSCIKAGIKSSIHRLSDSTSEADLITLVESLNEDDLVHGILVQLPLPRQINQTAVLDAISPLKDVDAFHPENVGRLVQGRPRFLPCTPHGIQMMLVREQIPTSGAHVVILGRSEIVGKPLAMMLAQKAAGANATVTICHSQTQNLAEITRTADILVAAIGVPEFVTPDMVRPGAVVIDVGINRHEGKLVGDVEFDGVSQVAAAITPVPGGVGPMTITMLLRNTLNAAKITCNCLC